MNSLLPTFPNAYEKCPEYVSGYGSYVISKDKKKYLDLTCGGTSYAVLGWGNKQITNAISSQLMNIAHTDYKTTKSEVREALAELIVSNTSTDLSQVFLSGGSGAEACEMAIHMSYQVHCEKGNPTKTKIISRTQSYHGSTMGAMSIGERPNLEFYRPTQPQHNHHFIEEHNPYKHKYNNESGDEYALRSAQLLEDKILELGSDNVCCFVMETMLGGLVGDVPPLSGYLKRVREICSKYDIHLVMDEVWCGFGLTGRYFCCEWDDVTPDFLFGGKALGCGYFPASCVLTTPYIANVFKFGSGRIETSCTFQGHLAGCAGALEAQRIITAPGFMSNVVKLGDYIRRYLDHELSDIDIFSNIRGRGVRNSLEITGIDTHKFTSLFSSKMYEEGIIISGKWHRISVLPPMNIDTNDLEWSLEVFVRMFKRMRKTWSDSIDIEVPQCF